MPSSVENSKSPDLPTAWAEIDSTMRKFFAPNIDRPGRIVRAAWGVAMLIGAVFASRYAWWASAILLAFAALAFYEATRGWCLVRACGIKTKI